MEGQIYERRHQTKSENNYSFFILMKRHCRVVKMATIPEVSQSSNSHPVEQKSTYWNLPNKGQLAILCLARLTDPLASTSIQVSLISHGF